MMSRLVRDDPDYIDEGDFVLLIKFEAKTDPNFAKYSFPP